MSIRYLVTSYETSNKFNARSLLSEQAEYKICVGDNCYKYGFFQILRRKEPEQATRGRETPASRLVPRAAREASQTTPGRTRLRTWTHHPAEVG